MASAGKLRFVMSPAFEPRILAGREMSAGMLVLTERTAAAARRMAPRQRGFLVDGIEAVAGVVAGRVVGRVVSKDFKTLWHEFGTRKMSRHAFLRPALADTLPGAPIIGGRT